jgi:hypothetical protein
MASIGGASEEVYADLIDAAVKALFDASDDLQSCEKSLLDRCRSCLWDQFEHILDTGMRDE